MTGLSENAVVAVIGAGAMGAGIAQVAASSGHRVLLYDVAAGAAEAGRARMVDGLASLVKRGKLAPEAADAVTTRVQVVSELTELAPARLLIEAVIERLDVKQQLFVALESIVSEVAILATNTSSISVTSIGAALQRPGRLVGMHFFNPAPIMRLVEVVAGVATEHAVAETVHATALSWGKIAVHTKSTPGFIVNRVARAFYAEPLRLLEEGVAAISTIDALFRYGGGFRMGPFELMDLIGNDVNYAVSRSVFEAMFFEPRFRPSILQQELVNAGHYGRKSGRGWYDYAAPAIAEDVTRVTQIQGGWSALSLTRPEEREGILITQTDGRRAAERERDEGRPVILHDLLAKHNGERHLGFAVSPGVDAMQKQTFMGTIRAQGVEPVDLPDWPGLILLRTLALIANEGFEAVLQGITDEAGVDAAMVHGVNYPKGPIAWAREIGIGRIQTLLTHLQIATGDMRYRPSLRLRMAAGV
jgi:3-hydroxybutyryl-CoA dehydrogenase